MSESTLQEKALELYVPGKFGYISVGKELGLAPTTVRHLVNPDARERDRILSNEAKRRRTGVCQVCGGPTRYHGHGKTVGDLCHDCQVKTRLNSEDALAKRRKGTDEELLDAIRNWHELHGEIPLLRDWTPKIEGWPSSRLIQLRFGTWNAAIEKAGFTPRTAANRPRQGGRFTDI